MNISDKELTLKNYEKMLFNEQYSDIFFMVKGEKIPAIRCIVASSSEVFHSLLYGQMKESNSKEIKLNDPLIEPECFKDLLRYIYTGSVNLTGSNLMQLYHLSSKLFLDI